VQATTKVVEAHNVHAIFSKITEPDIVNRILRGLMGMYQNVITYIDQMEETSTMKQLTIAKLTAQLQNIEAQNKTVNINCIVGGNATTRDIIANLQQEIATLKATSNNPNNRKLPQCKIHPWTHGKHTDATCYNQHLELRPAHYTSTEADVHSMHAVISMNHTKSTEKSEDIIGDTGCSMHMFHNLSSFTQYTQEHGLQIELGDNSMIPSIGKGAVDFKLSDMMI